MGKVLIIGGRRGATINCISNLVISSKPIYVPDNHLEEKNKEPYYRRFENKRRKY